MRSLTLLSKATKELRMNERISTEVLDKTIDACAWLIDIASRSVDELGWDPVLVRYLERLGRAAYEERTAYLGDKALLN